MQKGVRIFQADSDRKNRDSSPKILFQVLKPEDETETENRADNCGEQQYQATRRGMRIVDSHAFLQQTGSGHSLRHLDPHNLQ